MQITTIVTCLMIAAAGLTGCGAEPADAPVSGNSSGGAVVSEAGVSGGEGGATEIDIQTLGTEPVPAGTAYNYGNAIYANTEADMILVNKQYILKPDYKPADLVIPAYYADRSYEGFRYIRADAAAAYEDLVEGASAAGYDIRLTSAYRSYNGQKSLYDNYVAKDGQTAADKYSAKPGASEHQTGLAIDVSSNSVGWALTNKFGETAEGQWLAEHAHEYGFILRYPAGKEAITGYQYEPWHIRYVGAEAAADIHSAGVTLEEYLGVAGQ